VEEAYEAGIREMIFVTGRSKRAIEDHFDMAYELETELEAAGKQALLDIVRSVQPDDMQCVYVRQARALGLGHAVLCAEHLVGDEPFAVLLADDLMRGKPGGPGVLKQMADVFARTQSSVLAVQEVPLEHVHRYGVVAGKDMGNGLVDIQQMVEKPKAEVAPSRTTLACSNASAQAAEACKVKFNSRTALPVCWPQKKYWPTHTKASVTTAAAKWVSCKPALS
jgi:UTP--glucose-1-phosphate uridylyltransferase